MTPLFIPSDVHAELKAVLESPADGDTVAGVALIRGWAYDTISTVQVSSVELFVDDVSQGGITCCTTRLDVQVVFPDDMNAEDSGFGATVNWGELPAGSHTIRVEIQSTAGETMVLDDRNVTVVRLGDFRFLSQFNVDVEDSFAQVEENNTICLENIEITDKDSETTKFVKGIFRWQETCQCLILISTEEDGYCDF